MRVIYWFFLLLPACAAHDVRCDGRLQPVNLPAARVGAAGESTAAPTPTITADRPAIDGGVSSRSDP